MAFQRRAVIMAGGSGERFWPVSTRERPKQFLRLSRPDRSLLQEAVDRAGQIVGSSQTYVATGRHLEALSRADCPQLGPGNIIAEPERRNTMGCLVWVAAHVLAERPDDWQHVSVAVLTADHRVAPDSEFKRTVELALDTAERTGGLVTIGIWPTRPETGYGYVELGESLREAHRAASFREKPDAATARRYVAEGRYLWNSGMFFWTLPAFVSQTELIVPETGAALREMAGLLRAGELERAAGVFRGLPSVSVDYALMEQAAEVYVVESHFQWDDLGSWDALKRSYEPDEHGNVALGPVKELDTFGTVVYNESTRQRVNLLGVEGLVVVVTDDQVMVCPADRSQEVKRFLSE